MITKEVHVGLTFPYQKEKFQYGRVEFKDIIVIEENDDPDKVRQEVFDNLRRNAQISIDKVLQGTNISETPIPHNPKPTGPPNTESKESETSSVRPRRRRPDKKLFPKEDIPF